MYEPEEGLYILNTGEISFITNTLPISNTEC